MNTELHGCLICGEGFNSFCSETCRIMYMYREKPSSKCVIYDCKNIPKGLEQLCSYHRKTHCLHCAKKSENTFCSNICSLRHPSQPQCVCIHIHPETGEYIPCPETPAPLQLQKRHKCRKIGRDYHKICSKCYNKNHQSWIETCIKCNHKETCQCKEPRLELVLRKTEPCKNGIAKKILEGMRDTIDEMTKLVEISNEPNWHAKALEKVKLQIKINNAVGCAILLAVIHETNKMELLVIGEKGPDGKKIRYGFPGGNVEFIAKTVYRSKTPNNPLSKDVVWRREKSDIAMGREFLEEMGVQLSFNDLEIDRICVGIFDKATNESDTIYNQETEVIYGLIVKSKARKKLEQLPKSSNSPIQTVDKKWIPISELSQRQDIRRCTLNGLEAMINNLQNIHTNTFNHC